MDALKQITLGEDTPGFKLRNVLSISASMAVSFLILYGIIQAQKTGNIEENPDYQELRSVVVPAPPPPPPKIDRVRPTPPPPSLLNLEVSPADNPLQFAYSLAPVSKAMEPPKAEPVFDFSPEAFKPTLHSYKARHVYTRAEVDQPPKAVYKKRPHFDEQMMDQSKIAKISLMYIVNNKGNVQAVSLLGSGGESFDNLVMDSVKRWRFKPAVKDGKNVDCWVRQRVVLKVGSDSPFTL